MDASDEVIDLTSETKPKRKKFGGRQKGTKNKPKSWEKVRKRRKPAPLDEAARVEVHDKQKAISAAFERRISETGRDIAPLTLDINWERRHACKRDFATFCKTYLPNTFKLGWSDAHRACIRRIEQVFLEGGKFALAMPRGDGKTALCRSALIWGTGYGHRLFPFLIGSAQPKAEASLDFVKAAWYGSAELRQDFPEIAHAVHKLENRYHLAKGQIFHGIPTHIDWGANSIRYPILLFSREEAEYYESNDPGCLIHVPAKDERPEGWITRTAGITINTAGVDGSIRGEASVHPIILTQPRPDVVLIDDVQKDSRVDSSLSCDKLILLIDGAIGLLSGPEESIAAIMPCTVMREGDVADTYVDPLKRPEWRGERHARVISWPDGIDNERITINTPEGKGWLEYQRIYRQSLRKDKNFAAATEYYIVNRDLLDKGFVCSWLERFDKKCEISPQQSCMNLRIDVGSSVFMAECQNVGRKAQGEGVVLIKKQQLMEKTVSLPQRVCPVDTRSLVIQVDVQNEILYWTAFAAAPDFSGVFVDYGTYPESYLPFFRKEQTEEWSMLSKLFFDRYPQYRDQATKTQKGYRAPLEAKIYNALEGCIRYLLSLRFIRDDAYNSTVHINKIGIDTRWGQTTDTIKRFIREWSQSKGNADLSVNTNVSAYVTRDILVPYFGQGLTAQQKQFEEFTRTRGWLFEDNVNPQAKEVRWIWKPDAMGLYYLLCDVNRLKSFLFQRLASPPGTSGAISLFNAPPERHELFAQHVCESEYPEIIVNMTTSLRKEMWKERQGVQFDNDYLDCAAACMALASFSGSTVQHNEDFTASRSPQKRRRLSEQWAEKRNTPQP